MQSLASKEITNNAKQKYSLYQELQKQILKIKSWPPVVVHTCILILGRLRQEDLKFKARLGYIVRTCFKKKSD
jgi:hypothetical protein